MLGLGFHLGNVMKYIWRWQNKDGVEALKKARWYLDRKIQEIEKGQHGKEEDS